MALPNDYQAEYKDSYSGEEVEHIVAREVMKHRMGDLEGKLAAIEASMTALFSKLEASLAALSAQISKSSDMVKECREELRAEVDREFATKLELNRLEAKVDKMWAKITVAVSLAVGFTQIVLNYLGVI